MEKPKTEDLYKAIADVLDEALAEYDTLVKNEGIDYAQAVDDMKSQGKAIVGEGAADGMAKEEPMPVKEDDKDKEEEDEKEDEKDKEEPVIVKEEDKEKDKEDEEEDDEKLLETYKSLVAKMEERGLMAKVQKSEVKPEDDLRKSVDERFDSLKKAIEAVSDTVKKIADQPVPRKGVAGYKPLKKNDSEEAPALKKSEVVERLLDLRKKGDARVDSSLINRIETNRLIKSDVDRIKSLGIL